MNTCIRKLAGVILFVIVLLSLSCASSPQKQTELGDAEAYCNRGVVYAKKGQYDQAISDFTRALKINPKLADAYNNWGAAYAEKGQYDQAISDCTKALEINPNFAEAYNNRGVAYRDKGQYILAIDDLNRSLVINSDYALAYINRGRAHYLKGQYFNSMSDFTSAKNMGYKVPDKFLDDLREALGKDQKATIQFKFSTASQLLMDQGAAYVEAGELDKAITVFTVALERSPQYAEGYNHRGETYGKLGQLDRAIADFDEALLIDPSYARASYNRGVAYYYKKNYTKSWEDIHWAQRLGYKVPDNFLDDLRKASGRQE